VLEIAVAITPRPARAFCPAVHSAPCPSFHSRLPARATSARPCATASGEQLQSYEATIRKAEEAWRKVDEFLRAKRRDVYQGILDICVFSTPTNPTLLPDIRQALDHLSRRWADSWPRDKKAELRIVRALATAGLQTNVEAMPLRPRRDNITEPLEKIVRTLLPELDEDAVRKVVDTFHALRARAELRRSRAIH
jgi:hypothetical protein